MKVRLKTGVPAYTHKGVLIKHSNPVFEVEPEVAQNLVKRGIVDILDAEEAPKAKQAAKAEAAEEETPTADDELEGKTLKELQAIAKERGISARGLNKAALLEKLQGEEEAEQPALNAEESID